MPPTRLPLGCRVRFQLRVVHWQSLDVLKGNWHTPSSSPPDLVTVRSRRSPASLNFLKLGSSFETLLLTIQGQQTKVQGL